MIDTHAHIYAEEFDDDRASVILRAKEAGITNIILPNIDSESLPRMLALEGEYPGFCHAAAGLHPTSVKENYPDELQLVAGELKRRKYTAVGEIGIDLHWDKTFIKEQTIAFKQQVEWAIEYELPVIIHVRDSLRETLEALSDYKGAKLKGVFHSFTGTEEDAEAIGKAGDFMLGINGIVTFKNSTLKDSLKNIGTERLILETDAPYLAPVPFRGKRNESAYLRLVAEKLSEIYALPIDYVIKQTSRNASELFGFNA